MKEQDFGTDVKPGQLPDGKGGWTLYVEADGYAIEQDLGYKDVRPSP